MRETPITIRDLNRGLTNRKPNLNEIGFTECKNFVYKEKRLEAFKPFEIFHYTYDRFFPQVIEGKNLTFYLKSTEISVIKDDVEIEMILLDYSTHEVKKIFSSSTWKLIDYGNKWYLLNDKYMISNIPDYEDGQYAFVYDNVFGDCGTYFKGRGVIAGFYDEYPTEGWDTILGSMKINKELDINEDGMVDKNFIFWSGIGQNLEYALFPDEIENEEDFVRMIEENSFGYMPMEWSGRIIDTIVLGDNLFVFGTNGISVVYTEGKDLGQKTLVQGIGVLKRDSIAVSSEGILFVGSNNNLYFMNREGKIRNLFYKSLFQGKTDINIIGKEDFFIVNADDKSYIFYEEFLTEIGQIITCFIGDKVACKANIDEEQYIKLSKTNFGYNNTKQVTFIDFGIDGLYKARVISDGLYKTSWVTMIRTHNLYFGIAGNFFEVEIKGKFDILSYLNFKYLSLDNNQIRGQNVS